MDSGGDVLMACASGDLSWLRRGLSRGISPRKKNREGMNGLHLAAKNGRLDCMRYLLDNCDISVNESTAPTGNTPLHYSIAKRNGRWNLQCMKLLLERGADKNKQNSAGQTPLHLVAKLGHVKCLKALLGCGVDIHIMDEEGNTAYNIACLHGQHECSRILRALHWANNKDTTLSQKLEEEAIQQKRDRDMKVLQSRLRKEAADTAYVGWLERNGRDNSKSGTPVACETRQRIRKSQPSKTMSCNTCSQATTKHHSATSHFKPKAVVPIKLSLCQAKRNIDSVGKPEKLHPYTNYPPQTYRGHHTAGKTASNSSRPSRATSTVSRSTTSTPLPTGIKYSDSKSYKQSTSTSTSQAAPPPVSYIPIVTPPDNTPNPVQDCVTQSEEEEQLVASEDEEEVQLTWTVETFDEKQGYEQGNLEDESGGLFPSAGDADDWDDDLSFHDVGHTNSLNALSLPSTLMKGRTPAEVVQLLRLIGSPRSKTMRQSHSFGQGSSRMSFNRNRFQRRFSLGAIPEGQMVTSYSDEDASTTHLLDDQYIMYRSGQGSNSSQITSAWEESENDDAFSDGSDDVFEEDAPGRYDRSNSYLKPSASDSSLLVRRQHAQPSRLILQTTPPPRSISPTSPHSLSVVNLVWDPESNTVQSQVTPSPLPIASDQGRQGRRLTPPDNRSIGRSSPRQTSPRSSSLSESPLSQSPQERRLSPRITPPPRAQSPGGIPSSSNQFAPLPQNSLFAMNPIASKSMISFQSLKEMEETKTLPRRRSKSAPNLNVETRHVLKIAFLEFGGSLRHTS